MRILTLGCVELEDGALNNQHLPIVLMAYIAIEGPSDRRELARIFWPKSSDPGNNLSSTLSRIRRAAPDALVIDRHHVESRWRTDAQDLLDTPADMVWTAALPEFKGEFLAGFRLPKLGLQLEEWIYRRRDEIAGVAADALLRGAATLDQSQRHELVAATIDRVGIERLTAEQLNQANSLTSDGPAAIREPIASWAETIGIELEGTTETSNEGLIGRAETLADLEAALYPGATVNVFGLAGSGKSTLCRHALSRPSLTARHPGGKYPIELGFAERADDLYAAVAAALHLEQTPESADDFIGAINEPTMLLLDHAASTATIVAAVDELARVDALTVVVTSRTRLPTSDRSIRSLQLHGLSVEPEGTTSDAARLFLRCARDSIGPVRAAGLETAAVENLCAQVAGVPLAIELCAAWLRILQLEEIETILDNPALAHTAAPGTGDSLGKIVQQSWDLLEPDLQHALAELSIFTAGFTQRAAAAIGVQVAQLIALHDRSLVVTASSGRMTCHPLIQRFAAAQLATQPARRAKVDEDHRRHFAQVLLTEAPHLAGPDPGQALRTLHADHDNVTSSWLRLIETRSWDEALQVSGPLDTYLLRAGRLPDAAALYRQASAMLSIDSANRELVATNANNLAWVLMLQGAHDEANRQCQQGLRLAPEGAVELRLALHRTQASLAMIAGNGEAALAGYLNARDVALDAGNAQLADLLREDIGRAQLMVGSYAEARSTFEAGLAQAQHEGDTHREARSLLLLGSSFVDEAPERALVLLSEGETLAEKHGFEHLRAYFPNDRGYAHLAAGRIEMARAEFERGTELSQALGDAAVEAASHLGTARALLRSQAHRDAAASFQACLAAARRARALPQVLGAVLALSRYLLDQDRGESETAAAWQLASTHPATFIEDLEREGLDRRPKVSSDDRPASLDEVSGAAASLLRCLDELD